MPHVVLRGRAPELGWVLDALRRTQRTGKGALLAITGEPGIGKTAVVQEALTQARRRDFDVAYGKAEAVEAIALGVPLLTALRSGPAPVLDGAGFASLAPLYERPIWLVDRLCDLIEEAADRRPLLIAVDDVQWIDPLTRLALRVLPSRLAGSPVVWLLSARSPGGRPVDDVLAAAEGTLGVSRRELRALAGEDLAALARDVLDGAPDDVTTRLLAGVGGNPFWAGQVLSGLARRRAGGLPEDDLHAELMADVRERLGGLGTTARELVELVAVFGRVMPVALAAEMLGVSGAVVLEAARGAGHAGLLGQDETGLVMPHDLVREAVYADLPVDRRRERHRACGRRLLASGVDPLLAAPHFRASAGPGDREASEAILRAAEESRFLVPEQAAALAHEAFDLLDDGPPGRLDVGERVLAVLVDAQRHRDAVAFADVLLRRTGPVAVDVVARVQVAACRALWEIGDCREIEARVDAALARPDVPAVPRAQLGAVRALASTRTGGPFTEDGAVETLKAGADLGDRLTQQLALTALAEAARNTGAHRLVRERLTELQALSPAEPMAERARALQHLDRYDESETMLTTVRQGLPSFQYAQIWQDHNLGRLDAADAGARTLLRLAEETESLAHLINARMIMFGVAVYRGDLTAAGDALARVEAFEQPFDDQWLSRLRLVQGWLAASQGRPADAVAVLGPLVASADSGRYAWPWSPPWTHTLATIALAAGDTGMASRAALIAETGALRNPGVASLEGVGRHVRGLVDGDPVRLSEAIAILRTSPRPMLLAAALHDYGRSLKDDESSAALAALTESHRLFEAAGAWGYADAVSASLTPLGVRPPRRTGGRASHGWDALTGTEQRVAELIGQGHSNRSAARRLGVSPNTVGTHLRAVYTKLDVHSRVQLANRLAQLT